MQENNQSNPRKNAVNNDQKHIDEIFASVKNLEKTCSFLLADFVEKWKTENGYEGCISVVPKIGKTWSLRKAKKNNIIN